jgi:hypothetical protein
MFRGEKKAINDQAQPPPEAKRGTSGTVGGRVQRLIVPLFITIGNFFQMARRTLCHLA